MSATCEVSESIVSEQVMTLAQCSHMKVHSFVE